MTKKLSGSNPALDIINSTNLIDEEIPVDSKSNNLNKSKTNVKRITLDIDFGSTERRTQPITLKVKPSIHKELKKKSKEFNRSVNDIVNKLLESYLGIE